MKIYAITPAFDPVYLPQIDKFFKAGHEFLQLRDKSADLLCTCNFVQQVLAIAKNYPHAKVILNASNNYEVNGQTVMSRFKLAGVQQSTHADKSSEHFCPKGGFNILSCHSKTDVRFAIDFGFMAATLSPVFLTQSHPEQTETLGIQQFGEICATSRIPIFALGGITLDMVPQFRTVKRCAGVAMIRGWFN